MKPRVLMIAYACDPEGAGDAWLGWGWAQQASRRFEVTLVTTPKGEAAISAAAKPLGIHPHFVKTSRDRGWLAQLAWQSKAFLLARDLHYQHPFELVHQTNPASFRVPFHGVTLGIPSIWGPITGGEHVPASFYPLLGPARMRERCRLAFDRAWLRHPAIQKSLAGSDLILAANRNTIAFLPESVHAKCQLLSASTLRPETVAWLEREKKRGSKRGRLQMLYTGPCAPTRALPLVFDAMLRPEARETELTVVGDGPCLAQWKRLDSARELGNRLTFVGAAAARDLERYYEWADVFVFPALRDASGASPLEAMARGLPVLCADFGGPGEVVDEGCGFKIPLTDPAAMVHGFAQALGRLHREPETMAAMTVAGRWRAARLFRWEHKREVLEQNYRRLLS